MKQYSHFIFFLFFALSLQGQTYLCETERLSVEDGLSNRYVQGIVQDSRGFMWFGTKYGLNRYDGNQFIYLTKDKDNLQDNYIQKLYEDPDSNLWVCYPKKGSVKGRFSGIDILDVTTFEVNSLETKKNSPLPFKVEEINKIYSSSSNKWLYILTIKNNIYVYKGKNHWEFCYSNSSSARITSLHIGKRYHWLYCNDKVLALDQKFRLVTQQKLINPKPDRDILFIGEENEQTIWLTSGAHNNFEKWRWQVGQPIEKRSKLDFLPSDSIKKDLKFEYIKTWNGYIHESLDALSFLDSTKQNIFSFPILRFLGHYYIDRQGNTWLSNSRHGLYKFTCKKNKFTDYANNIGLRAITTVCADSLLLTNTYQGLRLYNLKTKAEKILAPTNIGLAKSRDKKSIWVKDGETSIAQFFLPNFEQKQVYSYKSKDIRSNNKLIKSINTLYEDKTGRTWIGSSQGIHYKDKEVDSLEIFKQYGDYKELAFASINDFYENEEGLWVATSEGLYLINKRVVVKQYASHLEAPFYLPHNYILNIYLKDSLFWLSTKGGGIISINRHTGNTQQFTTEEGLSHNIVYAILEDDYGYFWMSSNYGLMRFHPQKHTVNTFLLSDGLIYEEFNYGSFYKASNGQLYFGGVGIISFHPKDFAKEASYNIPLQITRYQYFDGQKSKLIDQTKKIIQSQKIVLEYTSRFFEIDYALLDYNVKQEKKYAYKIEGLDETWQYTNNHSIRINGLRPGNYILKIKGQGANGVWSGSLIVIPILVKQPFYMTWQFWLVIGLFIATIIIVYARSRVLKLRASKLVLEKEVIKRTATIAKQAEELRELDNVKSRFFANISHELRTPLTLILGPVSAILENHYNKDWAKICSVLETVKSNGGKLQNLIEEILTLSKLEAKKIELEESELLFLPFIRRLFLAFEAQAHLQQINFSLIYNLDEQLLVLLDEEKFEKILNNLLSNAIKYTPRGGTIALNISKQAIQKQVLHLELVVEDSGKGIHSDDLEHIFERFYQSKHKEAIIQGGTGIGLALAYEFAQLLGGGLGVESTLGKGSTFTLNLPIKIVPLPMNPLPIDIEKKDEASAIVLPSPLIGKEKTQTILIVEDNFDMRNFVADLLRSFYNILTAENGRIALDILDKNSSKIDLILSDVMMPEMDGFQLLGKIKEHENWSQLPVIMLTARVAEHDKLFALRIGVDDYLSKPFSRQELLIRIHNLLKNYTQRKVWSKEEIEEEEEVLEVNDEWLSLLEKVAKKEIGNSQFGITSLAYDLNISERQLRRKIKQKTGLTPQQYFRLLKLDFARHLLETKKYDTVSQVVYKVGFSNIHYFSKIYFAEYGKMPSNYFK